jgi:hypothetical protein
MVNTITKQLEVSEVLAPASYEKGDALSASGWGIRRHALV